jgi:hypothetical protein
MDDFEDRLKRDAAQLPAEITPELRSRIRASLEAQAPPRARPERAIPHRAWLAAGLSGAAAAMLVLALLPRQPRTVVEEPAVRSVPDYVATFERALPLKGEQAELTAPLEEELENLRADLEQARRSVAEDMAF